MNSLYVLSVVLALTVHVRADYYGNDTDSYDMKAAVANVEILRVMVGCFLDTNPCNNADAWFKKNFPDAFQTACVNCNDIQKGFMHVFLDGVKEKLPKEFEILMNKYDPEGKYLPAVQANVAAF